MLRRASARRLCDFLQPVRPFHPALTQRALDTAPHSRTAQGCVRARLCVSKRLLERRHGRRFARVIAAAHPGAQRSTTSVPFPPRRLKSPWGLKDCEMTLLRSLDLLKETRAGRDGPPLQIA